MDASDTRQRRILVVEDEPAILAGIKDNLELEEYEVLTATDGAEGLKMALDHDPETVAAARAQGNDPVLALAAVACTNGSGVRGEEARSPGQFDSIDVEIAPGPSPLRPVGGGRSTCGAEDQREHKRRKYENSFGGHCKCFLQCI